MIQPRVAVGTTSVRTLETAGRVMSGGSGGETDLFIYPGFAFQRTGAMLTNFHLPGTSLLLLVCAFAGKDFVMQAYRHAVEQSCPGQHLTTGFHNLAGTATITGVGFFDKIHNQTGVALNGIELHPALAFQSTDCKAAPKPSP